MLKPEAALGSRFKVPDINGLCLFSTAGRLAFSAAGRFFSGSEQQAGGIVMTVSIYVKICRKLMLIQPAMTVA
ncbi:hypothetical protein [Pseudomonas chlororaphis]|uniref:hypothetical protein n=1 Tax=Pseudomonas chlororaphis TaxID=587753 RepID=UPI000F58D42C|nr:hypothetical protein [Pseudomonas chlororaphis]